jgi:membrane-associated phospholipid phosphatase
MFETSPNLYLQSFASPWLDQVMLAITWTGNEPFIVGILCVVALGVDFRRGFILLQIVLFTLVSTDLLKTLFALPRPFYLDANLSDFGKLTEGLTPLKDAAATTFFGSIPDVMIETYRNLKLGPEEYGFPSGHTAGVIALWGGMALMFRKKSLVIFAFLMAILMMISRMYLARHFLADVLGGAALALVIIGIAAILLNKFGGDRLFQRKTYSFADGNISALWLYAFGFVIPFSIILSGEGFIGRLAAMIGINFAFLLLISWNVPAGGGAVWHRILRVLVGFVLFFIVNSLVKVLPLSHEEFIYLFIKGFLPPFVLFFCASLLVSFLMKKDTDTSSDHT